ncbi:30S ribosomal protein S11 [bacterium (Candidatus Gribaldobacteria) CG_4_9_14_3_um_filter_36_15]|uniref:Small ribosomal subunit protein uS11 n=4 Tax=Candidatus Gribaldobacteria TaxID=2798536 RepID=A0A2M7VKW9_9BACT|nr:MAG: 30S ribosomal protein S11 [bacterium (Candidatus Gribaldobacteria) CG10_big_fil_rev_8_21_14_0_10_37_46]PIV14157.1 MAG: 30S ribosomal protein S11 [bacterium (Candidatus Gribaldobacteria) CG03_land_8_20_14_0_80_36_40]PJA02444.1 MAG: 30S ribosomal protein S11 [bacterium (Candidatus Gribaldobacteria) CG_4_10_14_0_2_um_filter_36_18]PJB09196.1 MAG: 30S ribosomal protein S11 [bacterium (Candidatus Gribaldobacteria) CG_4_9_14_3_um_filter_36_15]
MGKKRIIQKTEKEILKEREDVEKALRKEIQTKPSAKIQEGNVYINSSYNNTTITLTDIKGNVLAWKTAGSVGFKGAKKGTSFAASRVASAMADIAQKLRIKDINIFIKGIGGGRESALRSLAGHGLEVISIRDVTPIPHNGCRPRKVRRV